MSRVSVSCECGYTTKPQPRLSTARQMLARHKVSTACLDSPRYLTPEVRHGDLVRAASALKRIPDIGMPGPWVTDALCTQVDPEIFYPAGKGNQADYAGARKVCEGCPVKAECLEYALDVPSHLDHGMWAGTTPRDRAAIRKRRRVA